MIEDNEIIEMRNAGQRWNLSWHPAGRPPPGKRHGSTAICRTEDGSVVLVSQDGGNVWGFPGGRPEPGEDWYETLAREVEEEACASVMAAVLLGFSRACCIEGHEEGRVLVRALYKATVALHEWKPVHETTHRKLVALDDAMATITFQAGSLRLMRRWIFEATR